MTLRADAQAARDRALLSGENTAELDELIAELDMEITRAGIRGSVTAKNTSGDGKPKGRRHRSTRRRQDVAPMPRRKVSSCTVGKVFTAPDGKSYRPSMFITLTL